jgi:hypothetical protein
VDKGDCAVSLLEYPIAYPVLPLSAAQQNVQSHFDISFTTETLL